MTTTQRSSWRRVAAQWRPWQAAFDVRSVAGWFRLIAFAEAVSWVGLLVGMYFKYLGTPRTEVGVKVFGPVHGGVFIAFVVGGAAGRHRAQVGRVRRGCWRCWAASCRWAV